MVSSSISPTKSREFNSLSFSCFKNPASFLQRPPYPSPDFPPLIQSSFENSHRLGFLLLHLSPSNRMKQTKERTLANRLSHTQASTNYKEAFALFDKRGNGRVALESLGDLLRACGQNPTLAEIGELEKSAGGDCELPFLFLKNKGSRSGRRFWSSCFFGDFVGVEEKE